MPFHGFDGDSLGWFLEVRFLGNKMNALQMCNFFLPTSLLLEMCNWEDITKL